MAPVWDRFIHHPFVMAMGTGSLPRESFKGYLVQDYLYLVRCIILSLLIFRPLPLPLFFLFFFLFFYPPPLNGRWPSYCTKSHSPGRFH